MKDDCEGQLIARRPPSTSATPVIVLAMLPFMLHATLGCGSSSSGSNGNGSSGGGSGTYPAFVPDVAQLVNQGGPQLKSAKLVTVTWSVDPNAAAFEDFDDKLGASSYWTETLQQYGVGPATSGSANHVRLSTAPMATLDVLDLETWLGTQIQSGAAGWPARDAETLYVVWVPPATKLTASGVDACMGNQGTYHSEVAVGSENVPYVFVDEACNGSQPLVDVATETGGHAIAEAVTDPHPGTAPAVYGFDAAHIAWLAWAGPGAEVADVCVRFSDAYFKSASGLPYSVQRLWSNVAAKAGHDPCGPSSPGPYYNVGPQNQQMLSTVVLGASMKAVKGLGYDVPVGTTKTFDVGYFSDAALPGPITLKAVEGDGMNAPTTSVLTLSVAKGSGQNGDKDTVTVTVNPGNAAGNAFLMTLVTNVQGLPTHYTPVVVQTL